MATRIYGMIKNNGIALHVNKDLGNKKYPWDPDYIDWDTEENKNRVKKHIEFLNRKGKIKGLCKDVK